MRRADPAPSRIIPGRPRLYGTPIACQEEGEMVRVGKPAPDFEAKAYVNGEIKKIKLSDYRGQWVMLYFYPGDFTFV
jgi:peroxiredoxin (alkyl hydroperoxide reductase subunit C)